MKRLGLLVLFVLLFFCWTHNYLWGTIGLKWISHVANTAWLIIVILGLSISITYRKLISGLMLPLLAFIVLLLIAFIFDRDHPYRTVLYAKTAFFVPLGLLSGVALVAYSFQSQHTSSCFLRLTGWLFSSFIIVYSLALVLGGWVLGASLLKYGVGQYYQGISRLYAISALIVVCVRKYIPAFLLTFCLFLAFLVVIAFSGAAAIASFGLAIIWLVVTSILKSHGGRFSRQLGLILLIAIMSYSFSTYLTIGGSAAWTINRLQEKVSVSASQQQTRPWLMMKGLELWSSSPSAFMFGRGILSYTYEVGYGSAYRHPHNLFILGLVWFGLLSSPFLVLIIGLLRRALIYLRSSSVTDHFAGLLFINYFLYSQFGGDFDQNRYLFFAMGMIYALRLLKRSGCLQDSESLQCHKMIES